MSEMDPRDPGTLYAEGPVAAEPPDDDLPTTSPLRDSGGTGPGPDDLDRLEWYIEDAMERVPVPMQYLCRYKGAARLVMPRAMVHLDTIRVGIRGFLRPTRCCVP